MFYCIVSTTPGVCIISVSNTDAEAVLCSVLAILIVLSNAEHRMANVMKMAVCVNTIKNIGECSLQSWYYVSSQPYLLTFVLKIKLRWT